VFEKEAKTIREMYDRLRSLNAELAALRGPLIMQIVHVIFRSDRDILGETRSAYTYTVPLDPSGIASGIIARRNLGGPDRDRCSSAPFA
jgi:hypothetical protein